jgi:hypothetical protein
MDLYVCFKDNMKLIGDVLYKNSELLVTKGKYIHNIKNQSFEELIIYEKNLEFKKKLEIVLSLLSISMGEEFDRCKIHDEFLEKGLFKNLVEELVWICSILWKFEPEDKKFLLKKLENPPKSDDKKDPQNQMTRKIYFIILIV